MWPALVTEVPPGKKEKIALMVFRSDSTPENVWCEEDSVRDDGTYREEDKSWFWPPRVP